MATKGVEVALRLDGQLRHWKHLSTDIEISRDENGGLVVRDYALRAQSPECSGLVFVAPAGSWVYAGVVMAGEDFSILGQSEPETQAIP